MTTTIPSGFARPDQGQADAFEELGYVPGARKIVTADDGALVAVRLGPPKSVDHIQSIARTAMVAWLLTAAQRNAARDQYIRDYNAGWTAAGRPGDSKRWDSGTTPHAWDDGYLDRAAGRPKWHLTHCRDHDTCGEA